VVNVQPMVTHEAAEVLADNMIELGVEKESIQIEETGDGKFLIVLSGSFKNKKSAERNLETINAKGVNASIEARNTSERRVEATVSKEKAESLLSGQSFAKRYKPCS
jgi:cell division septation protein DedD